MPSCYQSTLIVLSNFCGANVSLLWICQLQSHIFVYAHSNKFLCKSCMQSFDQEILGKQCVNYMMKYSITIQTEWCNKWRGVTPRMWKESLHPLQFPHRKKKQRFVFCAIYIKSLLSYTWKKKKKEWFLKIYSSEVLLKFYILIRKTIYPPKSNANQSLEFSPSILGMKS